MEGKSSADRRSGRYHVILCVVIGEMTLSMCLLCRLLTQDENQSFIVSSSNAANAQGKISKRYDPSIFSLACSLCALASNTQTFPWPCVTTNSWLYFIKKQTHVDLSVAILGKIICVDIQYYTSFLQYMLWIIFLIYFSLCNGPARMPLWVHWYQRSIEGTQISCLGCTMHWWLLSWRL